MKKGRLNKKEITFIKDNTNDLSDIQIAAELGRSVNSIKKQRVKLEEIKPTETIEGKIPKTNETNESNKELEGIISIDSNSAQLEIINMIKTGVVSPEQGGELLKSIAPVANVAAGDDLNREPTFEEAWTEKEYDKYVENVNKNTMFRVDDDGFMIPTDKFIQFSKIRGPIRTNLPNGRCPHKSVIQKGMDLKCNACGETLDNQFRQGMKGAANIKRGGKR